jgi:endo-1,4-beta-D-glucanase Y
MPLNAETEWMQPLAELMAREGLSVAEAATRLTVPLNKLEAAKLFKTKSFQSLLRSERLRFYAEVGRNPEWSRKTAIGQLLVCIQELMAAGEYDKAAEVILKATKVEGWLGNEATVTVFNGLSQRDLEAIRSRLKGETPVKPTNDTAN